MGDNRNYRTTSRNAALGRSGNDGAMAELFAKLAIGIVLCLLTVLLKSAFPAAADKISGLLLGDGSYKQAFAALGEGTGDTAEVFESLFKADTGESAAKASPASKSAVNENTTKESSTGESAPAKSADAAGK